MGKFIKKAVLFLLMVVGIIFITLKASGGYVDYFYEKFTGPKSGSFILGDSRSMQGIQPRVMNKYFENSDLNIPVLNYSFTIAQIAYGPLYLNSIKKKMDTSSAIRKSLYIVTVNPWMLSQRPDDNYTKGEFFETGKPPHNMTMVHHDPNFEYFIKNFKYFHFKSIIRRTSKMHQDGWLEESNLPKNTNMLNDWKKNQLRIYNDFAHKWKPSKDRIKYLIDTIDYLDDKGYVFLVRMPVDLNIKNLEENYWPSFDEEIIEVAITTESDYINFTTANNIFKTYDGNHLDKNGGQRFTKILCDSIAEHLPAKTTAYKISL